MGKPINKLFFLFLIGLGLFIGACTQMTVLDGKEYTCTKTNTIPITATSNTYTIFSSTYPTDWVYILFKNNVGTGVDGGYFKKPNNAVFNVFSGQQYSYDLYRCDEKGAQTGCTDSDGGKIPNTKGILTYYYPTSPNTPYNKEDYCQYSDTLIEYSCASDNINFIETQVSCSCSSGACTQTNCVYGAYPDGSCKCSNVEGSSCNSELDVCYGYACINNKITKQECTTLLTQNCQYGGQIVVKDCINGKYVPTNEQCASCPESWSCTSWSTCSNGQQTRTCTDTKNCGTTNTKPSTTQSCTTQTNCAGENQKTGFNFPCCEGLERDYSGSNGIGDNCIKKATCGNNVCDSGEQTSCPNDCTGGGGGGGVTASLKQKTTTKEAIKTATKTDLIDSVCTKSEQCYNDSSCISLKSLVDEGVLTEPEAKDRLTRYRVAIDVAGTTVGASAGIILGASELSLLSATSASTLCGLAGFAGAGIGLPICYAALAITGGVIGGTLGDYVADIFQGIGTKDLTKTGYCVEKQSGSLAIIETLGKSINDLFGGSARTHIGNQTMGWIVVVVLVIIAFASLMK